MNIPALSMATSQMNLQSDIGVAMLDKSLESLEDAGAGMVKLMEQSVTPNLGGNFDMQV